MTLNDIELMTYRRTGYADVPATDVVTRIRQWINVWHTRLLARPGVVILRDTVVTLVTIASQPLYVLPASVRRIKKLSELTTPTQLRMESLIWLREHDPGQIAVGIPELWAPVGWSVSTPPLSQLTIRLWPTPAGVLNYLVDAQTTVVDLTNSTDVPLLPPEFHWLLVEAACYEEWMRKADTRSGTARQDLETGFKEMRNWVNNVPDYRPTNMPASSQPSRLGGWYPHW